MSSKQENTAAIHIKNLHKEFADLKAVHNISFDIKQGEFFALLGQNGAGKSTTINIITGLGNKSDGDGFFTGKIRKQFPLWLETTFFQNLVKSYSPCKIQHGGLGAFYIKLRVKE